MQDQDSYCLAEDDLFTGPAREQLFRLAQPYLEQEGITATELVFSRARQRTLANDGTRLTDLILRVATLQVQQTRRPILDRRRELTTIVRQAMQVIDSLTRGTPSDFILTGDALSDLAGSFPQRGTVRVAIIIAAQLSGQAEAAGKAAFCFDLLESGARDEVRDLLAQTIGELVVLDVAAPAFGLVGEPAEVIDACLAVTDPAATIQLSPLQQRLRRLLLSEQQIPALVAALCQRMAGALDHIGALSSAAGFDEWTYLQALKRRVLACDFLAADHVLRQALEKRHLRLVQPERLQQALAEIPAFGRKALYLTQLYPEIPDGQARRDLLAALTFYLEHRDFQSQFIESGQTVEARLELAETLDAALQNPEIPDHRRDRMRHSILAQYMEIKKLAERRRDPRVVAGPDDTVRIGQDRAPLRNWSKIGLLFGPVEIGVTVGDSVDLTFNVQNAQIDLTVEASADIVRVGEDGIVAARYYCKDPSTEERIKAYFSR